MAANVKSDVFANFYTTPRTLNPSLAVRAAVFFSRATSLVAAADADATVYPVLRLPSHARILALFVANSTITGGSDYDLGLYTAGDWSDATVNPAVIASKGDIYVDGISMAVARDEWMQANVAVVALAEGDIANCLGQGTNAITGINFGRQIWEDAGVASPGPRPGTEYDLCWTATTVGTAAGTIVTSILYCFGA